VRIAARACVETTRLQQFEVGKAPDLIGDAAERSPARGRIFLFLGEQGRRQTLPLQGCDRGAKYATLPALLDPGHHPDITLFAVDGYLQSSLYQAINIRPEGSDGNGNLRVRSA